MQNIDITTKQQLLMPSYYDGELRNTHKGDGDLYHFTKFESFKEILKSMTLRTSSIDKLNDMNEANINNLNLNPNLLVMCQAKQLITEQIRLLCFSQSHNNRNNGIGETGANHPAMWAHYAEDSKGVCIVIDKTKFIEVNKGIFQNHKYWFEDVKYDMFNISQISDKVKDKTPEEFIENHWQDLFFKKYIDWEHEDEHRLCIMNYNGSFSLDGCIKYIVLGRKLFLSNNKNYNTRDIVELITNPKYKCYKKFIPHSFTTFTYSSKGYEIFECAFKIIEILEQNITFPLFREYIKWLNINFSYKSPNLSKLI